MCISLRNLTGTSAALLPRYLPNFSTISDNSHEKKIVTVSSRWPRWLVTARLGHSSVTAQSQLGHSSVTANTAKLTGPRTFTGKNWVGPVKLMCIIMFKIHKIRPKSPFGPVKAPKFSRCLSQQDHSSITAITAQSWLGHSSITAQVTAVTAGCNHFGHHELAGNSPWAHGEQSRWPIFFSWVVIYKF